MEVEDGCAGPTSVGKLTNDKKNMWQWNFELEWGGICQPEFTQWEFVIFPDGELNPA